MSQATRNKVVLVTGGNRGLGFEIVKQLASSDQPFTILATARSPVDLKVATGHASSEIFYPRLDITNREDLRVLQASVEELGGLDVLINCAGMSFETFGIKDKAEVMEKTLSLNYYGIAATIDTMLPLMHRGGRIVTLSSSASHDSKFDSPELHERVTDPNMTRQELDDLVRQYSIEGLNPASDSGWTISPYGSMYSTVKAFLNILTRIVARDHPELLINAICPGASYTTPRVQDQMPIKFKTAAQGASEPVRLAIGDIGGVTGKYWAGDTLTSIQAKVIDDWMGHTVIVTPRKPSDEALLDAC